MGDDRGGYAPTSIGRTGFVTIMQRGPIDYGVRVDRVDGDWVVGERGLLLLLRLLLLCLIVCLGLRLGIGLMVRDGLGHDGHR